MISQKSEQLKDKLSNYRRNLHKYPEKGWLEMRTSSLIARKLENLGYKVLIGKNVCKDEERMGLPSKEELDKHYEWAVKNGADKEFVQYTRDGFTGVIGILDCGPGEVVAMRFDIDALGVVEDDCERHIPKKENFTSENYGTMHACGHDGHTSIGLGVAEILVNMKDKLSGKIKLIFQPAEEGVRGAKSIVENGHLDDVDYVIGSHLMPSEDGKYHISPGVEGTLATTKLDVYFEGVASHAGAAPELGKNSMLAAATAVLNIHAIPRSGKGNSTVNVGTLYAGTGRNVICDRAKMELEVRGVTSEINDYMENYAIRIVEAAAKMHDCNVEIKRMGSAYSIECSKDFTKKIAEVCAKNLEISVNPSVKLGGSEDFSYMTNKVIQHGGKACFVGIQTPCSAAFHNRSFDFDEQALVLGVKMFSGIIWYLLGNNN